MQFWHWYSRMATKEHCFTELLPKPVLIRLKIILRRKAIIVPFLIQKKSFGYCCRMLHTITITHLQLHGFWMSNFFSTTLMFPEIQNTPVVTVTKMFMSLSHPFATPRLCWWLNKKILKLMFKPSALSTSPPTDACSPLLNRTDSSPPERFVSVLSLPLSILPCPCKDKHTLSNVPFVFLLLLPPPLLYVQLNVWHGVGMSALQKTGLAQSGERPTWSGCLSDPVRCRRQTGHTP